MSQPTPDELAAGPAATWPWGKGTDEDPYYTPADYVFGTPINDYLAQHAEGET